MSYADDSLESFFQMEMPLNRYLRVLQISHNFAPKVKQCPQSLTSVNYPRNMIKDASIQDQILRYTGCRCLNAGSRHVYAIINIKYAKYQCG